MYKHLKGLNLIVTSFMRISFLVCANNPIALLRIEFSKQRQTWSMLVQFSVSLFFILNIRSLSHLVKFLATMINNCRMFKNNVSLYTFMLCPKTSYKVESKKKLKKKYQRTMKDTTNFACHAQMLAPTSLTHGE